MALEITVNKGVAGLFLSSKKTTGLFLDYLVLSHVSKGEYTRQEITEALGPFVTDYLDPLLVCQYITSEGRILKLTPKGYERCKGFGELLEKLYPENT